MNEWVSVKDKLPEESGTYLVSGKRPDSQAQVWVCSFVCLGIASGWANSCKNPTVAFWMPLPEPPKANAWNRRAES